MHILYSFHSFSLFFEYISHFLCILSKLFVVTTRNQNFVSEHDGYMGAEIRLNPSCLLKGTRGSWTTSGKTVGFGSGLFVYMCV